MSFTNKPTDSELDILKILWDKKQCSVRDVHTILANTKDVGYTTTLKLMQIMFEKGIVVRDESHKIHLYTPVLKQNATQHQFVGKMVNTLFNGNTCDLVLHTLGSNNHSEEELNAIQTLLDRLKNK